MIERKINTEFGLSSRNNIFSAFSKCTLLKYLTILAKYYIYKNKFYTKNLCISGFEVQ